MRTIKLTLTLITLAGLISVAGLVFGTSSNAAPNPGVTVNTHWKGYASFSPTGAGPNVARCGEFPENVEVIFAGSTTRAEFSPTAFPHASTTPRKLLQI